MTDTHTRTPSLDGAARAVADADADLIAAVEQWRCGMIVRLDELDAALTAHVADAEGPDGFFAGVMVDGPHLAPRIARLTDEHRELAERIEQTRATSASAGLAEDPHMVKGLHAAIHELVSLLDGHIHRSCRLAHDAVMVDIGGPVG